MLNQHTKDSRTTDPWLKSFQCSTQHLRIQTTWPLIKHSVVLYQHRKWFKPLTLIKAFQCSTNIWRIAETTDTWLSISRCSILTSSGIFKPLKPWIKHIQCYYQRSKDSNHWPLIKHSSAQPTSKDSNHWPLIKHSGALPTSKDSNHWPWLSIPVLYQHLRIQTTDPWLSIPVLYQLVSFIVIVFVCFYCHSVCFVFDGGWGGVFLWGLKGAFWFWKAWLALLHFLISLLNLFIFNLKVISFVWLTNTLRCWQLKRLTVKHQSRGLGFYFCSSQ